MPHSLSEPTSVLFRAVRKEIKKINMGKFKIFENPLKNLFSLKLATNQKNNHFEKRKK